MNSQIKLGVVFSIIILIAVANSLSSADQYKSKSSIYEFTVTDIDGNNVNLSESID